MEPCGFVDEEDEKVRWPWKIQRQVEPHEFGCCECFEYFGHQQIHFCHVTTTHRCACDWYSHGAVETLKNVSQPSFDHLTLLVNTPEGMFE